MSPVTQISRLGTATRVSDRQATHERPTQPHLELVRRARRGDERAFSLLVQTYQPQVFNFVLRLVGDRSLAEDLTQEIFLRAFQALPAFSFRSTFRTWLFQVAKNRVLDEWRQRGRRPRQIVPIDEAASWLSVVEVPLERRETMSEIWTAIEALPIDLRMSLLLRDVVGLQYTEIAETLEVSLPTVKWRIFKARQTVVRALNNAETVAA